MGGNPLSVTVLQPRRQRPTLKASNQPSCACLACLALAVPLIRPWVREKWQRPAVMPLTDTSCFPVPLPPGHTCDVLVLCRIDKYACLNCNPPCLIRHPQTRGCRGCETLPASRQMTTSPASGAIVKWAAACAAAGGLNDPHRTSCRPPPEACLGGP